VFDADMVAVDSKAIMRTLNTAGSQSNTLCKTGCSLKWSMSVIIKGSYESNETATGAEAT
jgi:hypothetical protein